MASAHERFWEHESFVVVGDSRNRGFPLLTYRGLKQLGKKVLPVDLSGDSIEGDDTLRTADDLPAGFEAAVLELPREKTAGVIAELAEKGIRNIWIHQGTDTPEALEAAKSKGLNVVHGSCAVMYVNCTSFHKIHRFIWRILGKY